MRLGCDLSSFSSSGNVIDYLPKLGRDQGQQHDRVFEKRGSGVALDSSNASCVLVCGPGPASELTCSLLCKRE